MPKPPPSASPNKKPSPPAKKPLPAVRETIAAAERVSTAAVERAEDLLALIARKKQYIGEAFYEIGEALRELQKKKLHVVLGYASFAKLVEGRGVMSAAQAFKLIKLVSAVPREEALAMGQEKAFALVRYAEATAEIDTPGTLMESGKLPGGKAVAQASTREINQATKEVRSPAKKKASPEESAARKQAASVQAALRKRGAKDAVVTAVRSKGQWWLRAQVRVGAAAVLQGEVGSGGK